MKREREVTKLETDDESEREIGGGDI